MSAFTNLGPLQLFFPLGCGTETLDQASHVAISITKCPTADSRSSRTSSDARATTAPQFIVPTCNWLFRPGEITANGFERVV